MGATLALHIVAGSLGLISGFVALYAAKGAPLHRKAGMVFVTVMLTMSLTGITIAAVRGVAPALNIPAGLLTAYLVVTALATVRPPARGSRALAFGAMGVALAVGLASLGFGFEAIAAGGRRQGMPAFPFFMFGVLGVLAAVGDLRMIRSAPLTGARRINRHLWRMGYALFIAAMSFFIGQAQVIPKPIRIMPLLVVPVLAVLVTMLYWVWRVRVRQSVRGLIGLAAERAARPTA